MKHVKDLERPTNPTMINGSPANDRKQFVPTLFLSTPKIDEACLFLSNHNPDLAFITETWLKESIRNYHFDLPEYNSQAGPTWRYLPFLKRVHQNHTISMI